MSTCTINESDCMHNAVLKFIFGPKTPVESKKSIKAIYYAILWSIIAEHTKNVIKNHSFAIACTECRYIGISKSI